MLPVNGDIIRPPLAVERQEIEQYLERNGIAYCTDETNKSDDYTRNRIRNHILPYLEEEVNARAVSHINDAMERLREVQEFIEEQADQLWKQCVVPWNPDILLKV